MGIITSRPLIAHRALTLVPMQSVPYNQGRADTPPGWKGDPWGGYRWDCSGITAKWVNEKAPGLSTWYLPQICTQITWDQAEPGDLWGRNFGPRDPGESGHVGVIIDTPRTNPAGVWRIVDHGGSTVGGSTYGPDLRTFTTPPSNVHPWRVNATIGVTMKLGDRVLIKGANGDDVHELQTDLLALGFSVGPAGADSDFGNGTEEGVKAFQRSASLTDDGEVGPQTVAALTAALAAKARAEEIERLRPLVAQILAETPVTAVTPEELRAALLGCGLYLGTITVTQVDPPAGRPQA